MLFRQLRVLPKPWKRFTCNANQRKKLPVRSFWGRLSPPEYFLATFCILRMYCVKAPRKWGYLLIQQPSESPSGVFFFLPEKPRSVEWVSKLIGLLQLARTRLWNSKADETDTIIRNSLYKQLRTANYGATYSLFMFALSKDFTL